MTSISPQRQSNVNDDAVNMEIKKRSRLQRFTKPLTTHTLVLLLAACGSVATLTTTCSDGDNLDDSDLFETLSLNSQAVTVPSVGSPELIAAVADRTGLNTKQASEAISVLFDVVAENLKNGKKVNLVGLGSLTPKVRPARVYKNPKTGADVPRPAVVYLAWKTTNTLKGTLPLPATP